MVRGLGHVGQVGEFSRHTTGFVRQEAKGADRKMPVTEEAESGVLQLATAEDLRRRGALAEAMAACQMLIRRTPDAPRVLLMAAAISRDSQETARALEFVERALLTEPKDPEIICDAARIRRRCGDAAGAQEAYYAALVRDPCWSVAHLGLAELHADAGRKPETIYHLRIAVVNNPADLDSRERLATVLGEDGQLNEAAALRRETLRRAHRRITEEYTKIRTPSATASPRAAQLDRVAWVQSLLVFAVSGVGLAKFLEREESLDEAIETYRSCLRTLEEAAGQAASLDGLRRAFEAAAFAFSHCHHEMALLQEKQGAIGGAIYHMEEALRVRGDQWDKPHAWLGAIAARGGESISAIRDVVRDYAGRSLLPAHYPVTRWDFGRHAANWVAWAQEHWRGAVRRRHIALFGAGPQEIQVCFAIACVLFAQGHRVDVVWSPSIRFHAPDEADIDALRWDEEMLARELTVFSETRLPEGLDLIDLRTIAPAPSDPELKNVADNLARADVYRHAGTTDVDLTTQPVRGQWRWRMQRNLDVLQRMGTYTSEHSPDQLVVFEGAAMETAAAFEAARSQNVARLTWEKSADVSGAVMLAANSTPAQHDVAALWAEDEPHPMTADRRERVMAWLSANEGGDHQDVKPRGRHHPGKRAQELLKELQLDDTKPVVLLFAENAAALAALSRSAAFPKVDDWLIGTAEYFEAHREWQLVIRLHPDDTAEDAAEAANMFRRRWVELPENIRIIPSVDPINNYRLLEVAQLGLYYTDRIGLDMAVLGIQGITPGRPFFGEIGFTREAETMEDFFRLIRLALDDPDRTAMTEQQVELAWCFVDLMITTAAKPFPWPHGRFWQSIIEDWPMERVLNDPSGGIFEEFFAILGGERTLADGMVGSPD
jgi:tetratricopeptide (TPR) repeat protein